MFKTLNPIDVLWFEMEAEKIKRIENALNDLMDMYLQARSEGNDSFNQKLQSIDSMLDDLTAAASKRYLGLPRRRGEI